MTKGATSFSPRLSRVWVPWVILTSAFVIANVGNTLYVLFELSPSPLFGTMSRIVPLAALWYWFWHYLITRGAPVHVDTGLFLGVAPFAVIPVFVLRTEQWKGLLTLGSLLIMYLGAYAVAAILYYVGGAF